MRPLLVGVLLSTIFLPRVWAQAEQRDTVLRAMKDELERGKLLRVVGDPPYYIEYSLDDSEISSVSASYGAIVSDRSTRIRHPRVRIRVGDPKLDNSNHIYSDAARGSRYDPSQYSLDDNYEALRLGFWLATDRAYKQALQALARKKASLKNINVTEQLGDFLAAPAVSMILPATRKSVDLAPWRLLTKEVSGLFSSNPAVLSVEAVYSNSTAVSYFVNSEGSEIRYPDNLSSFRIRASGQAPDGSVVRDYAEFVSLEANKLPSRDELLRAATRVGDNIREMAKASDLESYSGPVLFDGVSGAQLLAEVMSRQMTYVRRPVTDPDRPINMPTGDFEGRLGSRILPEWMDVVDDATQKEWRGFALQGHYVVDGEGIIPKPVVLVEKGILKTYYAGRQPLQGVEGPNGHARLPGGLGNSLPLPGNVFVRASQTVATSDLKKKLLEVCKQRNKPFGIMIRKMDFPSTASLEELRRIAGGVQGKAVSRPLLIYKVMADGKEELVRGVRFRGLNARALKDIMAASDDLHLFNYMESGAPFAHVDAGGYIAPISIVAPALLVDDLELEKIPGELPKPPIVPPPPLTQ